MITIKSKDEIELMNIQRQMQQQNQIQNKQSLGFNVDTLYNAIENYEE